MARKVIFAQSIFDPGFVFDFCSVRGSMAAPCGRSNASCCGL